MPKCYVYIKNHTAIPAPFHVYVDFYIAKPPTPPEGKRPDGFMPNKGYVVYTERSTMINNDNEDDDNDTIFLCMWLHELCFV